MITKCPYCGEDLREIGVYEVQAVEKKYNINYSVKNECFEYGDSEELDVFGESSYYCVGCDKELELSYEEIFNS